MQRKCPAPVQPERIGRMHISWQIGPVGMHLPHHGLITGTNSAGTSNIGLIGDNSTGLYTGNWWNNFYLNGATNAGTSVLTTMSSLFIGLHLSKLKYFD